MPRPCRLTNSGDETCSPAVRASVRATSARLSLRPHSLLTERCRDRPHLTTPQGDRGRADPNPKGVVTSAAAGGHDHAPV